MTSRSRCRPPISFRRSTSRKASATKSTPIYSAFLWDIVPIIKAEIQALVNEGARYIQIDAPRYSYYIDPKWRRLRQE